MTVDEEKYELLVKEAKQKAKEDAAKKNVAEAWKGEEDPTKDLEKTVFLGYDSLTSEGTVLALVKDGTCVSSVTEGEEAAVVLDRSSFYAESGGQVGDTGLLSGAGKAFAVEDTKKTAGGVFLHFGRVTEGSLSVGEVLSGAVDAERRKAIMRNHTGAHLLQAALRRVLGNHVEQAGSYVDEHIVRFDFTHFSAMTAEELAKTETLVNKVILDGLPVTMEEMPMAEAKKQGAMALFGEKYGDRVRVVKAGNFSVEFCGGTHVENTGRLGLFKILSEVSVAAGVRRIEAVTGTGVMDYMDRNNALLLKTAAALKLNNTAELESKALQLSQHLKEAQKQIAELEAELAAMTAEGMLKEALDLGPVKLVCSKAENVNGGELRRMADSAKESSPDTVAVLASVADGKVNFACACGPDAVKAGAHAGKIVKAVAALTGGNGGGRPDSAMAGGKEAGKVDEALSAAADIVRDLLK